MINQLKQISRDHGGGLMTNEEYLARVVMILASKMDHIEADDNDILSLSAALEGLTE